MAPAAPDPYYGGSVGVNGAVKRPRHMNGQTVEGGRPGSSGVVEDIEGLFSEEGRKRRMPALRSLITSFAGVPGVIGLHGGFPPTDALPFESVSVKLRDGSSFEISEPSKVIVDIISWCNTLA